MQGFCVAACCGLIEVLRRDVPGSTWRIAGGPFHSPPGGMVDRDGKLIGHFWIEEGLPDGRMIIADVTADQFGYPSFIAEYAPDGRYHDALPEGWNDEDVGSEAERNFAWLVVDDMSFGARPRPFSVK